MPSTHFRYGKPVDRHKMFLRSSTLCGLTWPHRVGHAFAWDSLRDIKCGLRITGKLNPCSAHFEAIQSDQYLPYRPGLIRMYTWASEWRAEVAFALLAI